MQGFPESTINILKNTDTHLRIKVKKASTGVKLWYPLSYHPCWKKAVNTAIRQLMRKPDWHSLICMLFKTDDVRVQVSWKNAIPPAGTVVQNL